MEILNKIINLSPEEDIVVDKTNKRVIFYQYDEDCLKDQLEEIEGTNDSHEIEKVSVYSDDSNLEIVEQLDLVYEGKIDGFYNGEDAYIYSQFFNPERNFSPYKEQQQQLIEAVQKKYQKPLKELVLPDEYEIRKADVSDVIEMANVFGKVFETYPTPMDQPKYIKKVMKEETIFSLITHDDKIVSIASADINPKYKNAEITDCATLPEFRGNGFLSHIIAHLEDRLKEKKVPNLFSLTRAISTGMNHVIAKHGYSYRGTLVQNCDISGSFEDMNIWVKQL
ncbi:putative beta-lysine N-acetyltransferase [Alkaliphilus hydrothermalis]|uniref:Beta-lysine N-acetyltransferase n=1 Tax=Alkaliphilus hydrothermalis TaxID=1482730 RepID=A0ABS2NNE8_9FIRM|nr:putative beta-lysine N-acetyltransferase [Alkaliphilus hydrothermalis]MBM7614468.1 putative beta-lysine N-acetyltransferase [Alkaliphilus hydrothermalis]